MKYLEKGQIRVLFKKYSKWSHVRNLFTDPKRLTFVAAIILTVEFALNALIISRVPYTEIDWKAYMQECEGFLNGTLDYSLLKGDTGPLVYPAGFVYVYSIFYFLTDRGQNVRLGQYIFMFVYLSQLFCVLRIYKKTLKVPPYVLLITILTSYRIHSIYVLRLFNDPAAMLLFFISLNLFADSRWTLGSVFFSLAVSIKMNILLFAPALLLLYLTNMTIIDTFKQLSYCAFVQFFLGLPFMLAEPIAYVKGSFDLGRVFNHTWTVNYRFLPVEVFESKYFHLALLTLHLLLLCLFFPMSKRYFDSYSKLRYVQSQIQPQIDSKNKEIAGENKKRFQNKSGLKMRKPALEKNVREDSLSKDQKKFLASYENSLKSNLKSDNKTPDECELEPNYHINFDTINQLFILPMFLCNFIGIVCARSLHYQFYSWYFHTLPYLLWCTPYTNIIRFLILALIELSWNTYPSTIYSSLLLHICHISILVGIYKTTIKASKFT